MSDVPPKPWEINRPSSGGTGSLHSSSVPSKPGEHSVDRKKTPPPIPTLPSEQIGPIAPYQYQPQPQFGSYGSYGPSYGGYGYNSMYGGNRYYGSYGQPYGNNGGFMSQAEESTRTAFQSVESIVRAFSSVSAMLESTFGAVYSSFRAVLDVADQFSRLKTTFSDILKSITIFRFIRYLFRRAKGMFVQRNPCDEAWSDISAEMRAAAPNRSKSWPVLLFLSVVFAGPYLIWKLLSSGGDQPTAATWASGQSDHVVAKVEYDFQARNSNELSVKADEMLKLAPKEMQPHINEWVMASVDGEKTGMVPANYVKILGIRRVAPANTNPPPPPLPGTITTTPNLTASNPIDKQSTLPVA